VGQSRRGCDADFRFTLNSGSYQRRSTDNSGPPLGGIDTDRKPLIAAAKMIVPKGSHVWISDHIGRFSGVGPQSITTEVPQAARTHVSKQVLMAPAPNAAQFGVLMCPPSPVTRGAS
jgi:hypothetical protein